MKIFQEITSVNWVLPGFMDFWYYWQKAIDAYSNSNIMIYVADSTM